MDSLARSLTHLGLDSNVFEGELDLSLISPYLKQLSVSGNLLSGTLALDASPRNISFLRLDNNNFNGTITLENLPARIRQLSLQSNMLTGSVDLTKLPDLISLNQIKIQFLYLVEPFLSFPGNGHILTFKCPFPADG